MQISYDEYVRVVAGIKTQQRVLWRRAQEFKKESEEYRKLAEEASTLDRTETARLNSALAVIHDLVMGIREDLEGVDSLIAGIPAVRATLSLVKWAEVMRKMNREAQEAQEAQRAKRAKKRKR